MWHFPQRRDDDGVVEWEALDYSEIVIKDNWRVAPGSKGVFREGDKTLPSIVAKKTLNPGDRILCFGRLLHMDPKVPPILAASGHSDNVNPFQYLCDVSKGETLITMDASPFLDPLVTCGDKHVVPGKGLFCWANVQEPLVGYMPNVLFQKSTNWTRDGSFLDVAVWLRGPGNWAWFNMSESLATQLDRDVRTDEVEMFHMVVLERIEVGEHLFASRGRAVFPSLGVNRIVTLEQQLNRSPLCMSQRFINVATRMMNATGFGGSLTERIAQLFVDVGKPCDVEAVRTTLCVWEPRSRENRMMAITSELLNNALSSDVVAAIPPNVVKVVQLWIYVPPKPAEPKESEYTLDDDDLEDFLALLGSDVKRNKTEFKDGAAFDKAVKDIFSAEQ